MAWWSSAGVIHYNFLSPGQTITAESYCEEIYCSQRCSQRLLTERVRFFRMTTPAHTFHKSLSINWTVGGRSSTSTAIFFRPFANRLSPFLTFSELPWWKLLHQSGPGKKAFVDFVNSRPPSFFTLMGFLDRYHIGKSVLIRMVPISIESDEY